MKTLKNILPGLLLILAVSVLLAVTGRNSRTSKQIRIATFVFASRPSMDMTARGFSDGLAESGFIDGKGILLTPFNAENDLPTANAIADQIVEKKFDMVITASTHCLQVMAKHNEAGTVTHVFAAVTNPFSAGVGINGEGPSQHKPWMAGIGTFQPVEASFILARELNPGLKSVGVPWCTALFAAEACIL